MADKSGFKTIHVLLVDTDDAFAGLARAAFKDSKGGAVLSCARTLTEARALTAADSCGVAFVGLRVPDGSAVDLLTCNGEKTGYPVVVLAGQNEEREAEAAVHNGAFDYFLKDRSDVSDLPRFSMRCVREWQHMVERERAEKMVLQLRDQVHRYQQLVASGLMERGAAHDIQNALTPILECAETALAKIPPRGQARGEIEHVIRITKLARELVRNASRFDKTGDETRIPVDVRRMTEEILDILRPVSPAGIEIRIRTESDEMFVAADAAQLKRVIMKLCLNAFDAMRSIGGVLDLDLDFVKGAAPDEPDGPCVRLTVTDTGRGMTSELIKRILEPAGPAGMGDAAAGLGIPLAREIIRSHGGDIVVESEVGKGTVFQVLLPRSDKPSPTPNPLS